MDIVLKVGNFPQKGETTISNYFNLNCGGKGANQAVACSKLGGNVAMIGTVGNDLYGQKLIESLQKNHVDSSGVIIDKEAPTGIAVVLIENHDNRIVINQGANAYHNIDFIINFIRSKAKKGDILVSQLEIPVNVVFSVLKAAKGIGMNTILNPAPVIEFPIEMYQYIDMLIPNEKEVEQLSGIIPNSYENISKIRRFFQTLKVNELIITLGDDGCCYLNDNQIEKYPAYKTKVMDTTAAGDTFIGAYVAQIAIGVKVREAINFASLASSITVSRFGAQPAMPTLDELKRCMNKG